MIMHHTLMLARLIFAMATLSAFCAQAQLSDHVDPNFGVEGIRRQVFNVGMNPVKHAIRTDNQIVVLMRGTPGNGYLGLALFDANGSALIPGFGQFNGYTLFGSSQGGLSNTVVPTDLLLLPDNSILVGGQITRTSPTRQEIMVAKFTPNGQPDATFGNNGVVSKGLQLPNYLNLRAHGMALGADGSIYMAGSPTSENVYIARFSASGVADENYGTNGFAVIQQVNPTVGSNCKLAVLSDNRLMAVSVAQFNIEAPFGEYFAPNYSGFQPSGLPDPSFQGGIRPVEENFSTNANPPSSFIIGYDEFFLGDLIRGTNDTLYITGCMLDEDEPDDIDLSTVLISILPDGTYNPALFTTSQLDTLNESFFSNLAGVLILRLTNDDYDCGNALALDGNGLLALAGNGYTDAEDLNFFRVLSTRGEPQNAFGSAGLVTYPSQQVSGLERFIDAEFQSNGALVCLSPDFNATLNREGFYLIRFGESEPLSAVEITSHNSLKLYPNPAETTVCIEGAGEGKSMRILAMNGQCVRQAVFSEVFDVSGLPPGLYWIEISNKSGIQRSLLNVSR